MANIQDRGKQKEKRWQARYRDPDGRQVSKSFRRKIDAARWLKQVESDMTTGRYMDPKAGRVTLESFAKDWLKSQTYDDSTPQAVESRFRVHILSHLGHIELRNIRPSTVRSWLRSRQDRMRPVVRAGHARPPVRCPRCGRRRWAHSFQSLPIAVCEASSSRGQAGGAVDRRNGCRRSSLRILSDTRRSLSLPPVSGCAKVRCSASGSSMSTFSGSGSWCVNK